MWRPSLVSPDAGALNIQRLDALRTKAGDKMPYVAVAALGALTQLVAPEVLEEALLVAQASVFLAEGATANEGT